MNIGRMIARTVVQRCINGGLNHLSRSKAGNYVKGKRDDEREARAQAEYLDDHPQVDVPRDPTTVTSTNWTVLVAAAFVGAIIFVSCSAKTVEPKFVPAPYTAPVVNDGQSDPKVIAANAAKVKKVVKKKAKKAVVAQ